MDKIQKIIAPEVSSVAYGAETKKMQNTPQPKDSEATKENSLTEFHPTPEDTRPKKNIFQKIIDFFKGLFGPKDTDNDSRYDVNGKLDMGALQGRYADCALIGTCYALQYSDFGKEILKDSIKINKNESGDVASYAVHFRGYDYTCEITKDELENADALYNKEDSRHYSTGDDDMLLLELAYAKMAQDIGVQELEEAIDQHGISYGDSVLDGINHNVVAYALTGKSYDEIATNKFLQTRTNEILNKLEDAKTFSFKRSELKELQLTDLNDEKIVLNSDQIYEIVDYEPGFISYHDYTGMSSISRRGKITLRDSNNCEYTLNPIQLAIREPIHTTDINGEKVTIVGQHAYAVKSLDDKTITIVNPYDTSVDIVLDIDNFKAISKEIDIETLEMS